MKLPLVLAAMALLFAGCTTSDAILTGAARPATSADRIQMYLRAPATFQSIALITATSNSTPIRSTNKTHALEELRKKAAALGANGVVLTIDNGSTATTGVMVLPRGSAVGFATSGRGTEVEVQGEAIWVDDSTPR